MDDFCKPMGEIVHLATMEHKALRDVVTELTKKLRLERIFERELVVMFGRLAKDFRSEFSITGQPTAAGDQAPVISAALDNHIRRTQGVAARVDLGLDPVGDLDQRDDVIDAALVDWRRVTAKRHSSVIADTNVRQMNRSVDMARDEIIRQEASQDRRNVAAVATAILARMFRRRAPLIAVTETQEAFEAAKQIRAQGIIGETPFPLSNVPPVGEIAPTDQAAKTWQTVGDDRVRATHAAVDGTELALNGVFQVGSGQLRFPGDTLLFAPISEIINCRCSAIYRNRGS